MQEFLQLLKAYGPAVGISLAIAFALWRENGQLQAKTYELYERLVNTTRESTSSVLRYISCQPPENQPGLVSKYLDLLERKVTEAQNEVAALKAQGDPTAPQSPPTT